MVPSHGSGVLRGVTAWSGHAIIKRPLLLETLKRDEGVAKEPEERSLCESRTPPHKTISNVVEVGQILGLYRI